jgi:hypothetical protein
MHFKNSELAALINGNGIEIEMNGDETGCDVVFGLFLEPDPKERAATFGEQLINTAIRYFQPAPVLSHCELVIPPVPATSGKYTSFATYLGKKSGWQNENADCFDFYLIKNAPRWRAVPIFSANASNSVREECCRQTNVDYSLARYVYSAPPLRAFSSLLSAERTAPAHCATLAARILRKALDCDDAPRQVAAWYGPSSLYLEMCTNAGIKGRRMGAGHYDGMHDDTATSVEKLLRAPLATELVQELGDTCCLDAINALTMRVCGSIIAGDEVSQTLTQKQLATALLRWVMLRDGGSGAEAGRQKSANIDISYDSEEDVSSSAPAAVANPDKEERDYIF